jgi:TDG/mug DNA glycosylase family protein
VGSRDTNTVPPILAPNLRVLFVGINPSLRSAEVGHHFARPGNRFWPTLHAAGFTPRRLLPEEDGELPRYGLGITNVAHRPTRQAAELTVEELRAGAPSSSGRFVATGHGSWPSSG